MPEAHASGGIAIVYYPEIKPWIIKDLAERFCLEFTKRGHRSTLINSPLAGYDTYYHFNYLQCRGVLPHTKNFTYVTHVNTPAKLSLLRGQAEAGIVGICMSEDTARRLRELTGFNRFVGLTPPALRYGEFPDLSILIASRLYDDGRKNLTTMKDALDRLKGPNSVLNIMGSGWEEFIAAYKDQFKAINYHPVFSERTYLELIETTNLLIYSGFDEGAISVLDYLASGKRVLATAQGYHLDYADCANLYLFSDAPTLDAQISKIQTEINLARAQHKRVTDWDGYCARHVELFGKS